ncbi:MAG: class II glutamine amidotransferase [Hyphomicrobiaceae bacterium]|nr:class II glutamine amidotransferase [Hyphomicrobiaceae bacterium]
MCRWVAYIGEPVFLETFVSLPCQSLVQQSHHARESRTDVNGDGFGLGWYGERPRPGLFRDIRPAWSDDNLLSIAHQIRSRLFFAHVRASTGTSSTRSNCHPFTMGSWLFMHNGQIGGYTRIKRRLEHLIPDELFEHRHGTTDSELIFLLMLANGLETDPVRAVEQTLGQVLALMQSASIEEPLRFTAAFTNGDRVHAVRYASDPEPPTLYTRAMTDRTGMLVVSEPLDDMREGWRAVAPQQLILATPSAVEAHAIAVCPRP